jgi:hypothetical protein
MTAARARHSAEAVGSRPDGLTGYTLLLVHEAS